jgi:hypothetical protein
VVAMAPANLNPSLSGRSVEAMNNRKGLNNNICE